MDRLEQADPPGEASVTAFAQNVSDSVLGVGQVGCGFESQLESWYRFLVDPDPPLSVKVGLDYQAVRVGTDSDLLAQRAAFLRPDSLLVILQLTDENVAAVVVAVVIVVLGFEPLQGQLPVDPRALSSRRSRRPRTTTARHPSAPTGDR